MHHKIMFLKHMHANTWVIHTCVKILTRD